DGARQLRSGTSQLSDGATGAANGAAQLAVGARDLAAGGTQLADGSGQLSSGAFELMTGLREGSDDIPAYTDADRERLARTAATPVEGDAERLNAVDSYGEALAPYFIALALWVGAMAVYLLLRPWSARAVASTTGSIRTALAGYVPGLALSVVQVVLLLTVLQGVLGIDPASQLLLIVVALATAAAFTALNQMFVALFGGAGRFVALVFVSLQLTSAGGTYPIETAPGFFTVLHDLLPMTYAVDGLRVALAGGTEGVTTDLLVLAGFTVLALAVTILAARRRQTVTVGRLHPTLRV
ncbi:YhgE/Pip domain protein, partial [Aeromicrobium marinum DSM 15272]